MNTELATDHRLQQLAAARSALAAKGKNPRQLGNEARQTVLEWIYRWGFTSSSIIQQLLNKTSGGYANKLVKQGWLASTRTASGMPTFIFTLTKLGLEEAERHATRLLRYHEIDPYKINQQLIRHDLLAQQVTVNALRSQKIVGYQTERIFASSGDKSRVKKPDVTWLEGGNRPIGVEIELSAKWARDLDEFVLGIGSALQSNNNAPSLYSKFMIFSDSKAIIERYKGAMQPRQEVRWWKKDQRNHWIVEKTTVIPDWLIKQVDFLLLGR